MSHQRRSLAPKRLALAFFLLENDLAIVGFREGLARPSRTPEIREDRDCAVPRSEVMNSFFVI